MNNFNIVFKDFEKGEHGIFIEDQKNNFFEGIMIDSEHLNQVFDALNEIKENSDHDAAVMCVQDSTGSLRLLVKVSEERKLNFAIKFQSKRQHGDRIIASYFQGETNLFYRSTPAGGNQFQAF